MDRLDRRFATPVGLVLTALPILFTLFPDLGRAPLWLRVTVALVWLPGAVLLHHGQLRRDAQLDELLGPPLERRDEERRIAGERLLQALLECPGFPPWYEFRLYLYDEDHDVLIPSSEPAGRAATSTFAPGVGVTGRAWQTGLYQVARGAQLLDEAYGLDAAQRRRFRHLQVVAAMPVRTARNEVIAVLTGASPRDDGLLASPEGQNRHHALARAASRVLVDVLQVAGE